MSWGGSCYSLSVSPEYVSELWSLVWQCWEVGPLRGDEVVKRINAALARLD